MRKKISLLLAIFVGVLGTYVWGSELEDTIARMQKSADVPQAITAMPDKGIPEEVLSSAKCIVVVPGVTKLGRGVATCRTSGGWSGPGFIALDSGKWGLHTGVDGADLVLVVMNDQGFQAIAH